MDHLQKTLLTIVGVLTITSIILVVTCFIYIWAKCAAPHMICCCSCDVLGLRDDVWLLCLIRATCFVYI